MSSETSSSPPEARLLSKVKTTTTTTTTELDDGTQIVESETLETNPDGSSVRTTRKETKFEETAVVMGHKRTVETKTITTIVETTTEYEREIGWPGPDREMSSNGNELTGGNSIANQELDHDVNGSDDDRGEDECEAGTDRNSSSSASNESNFKHGSSTRSADDEATSEQEEPSEALARRDHDATDRTIARKGSKKHVVILTEESGEHHNTSAEHSMRIEDSDLLQSVAQVVALNSRMDELKRDLGKIEKKFKHKSYENKLKLKNVEAQKEIVELKQKLEVAKKALGDKIALEERKSSTESASAAIPPEKSESKKENEIDSPSRSARKLFFQRNNSVHSISNTSASSLVPEPDTTTSRRDSFSRSRTLSPRRKMSRRQRTLSPLRRSLTKSMKHFKDTMGDSRREGRKSSRRDLNASKRSASSHDVRNDAIREETANDLITEKIMDKKTKSLRTKANQNSQENAPSDASFTNNVVNEAPLAVDGRCFYHPDVSLVKSEEVGEENGSIQYVCPLCSIETPSKSCNINSEPQSLSEVTSKNISADKKLKSKHSHKPKNFSKHHKSKHDVDNGSHTDTISTCPPSPDSLKGSFSSDYFVADHALFPIDSNSDSLKELRSSWSPGGNRLTRHHKPHR